jgi:hypothetical protein
MKPAVYVDIQSPDGRATAINGNNTFALLHGAITELPHQYALAIPGLYLPSNRQPKQGEDLRFSKLRIFAEDMQALEALNSALSADNIQLLYPKTIPADFAGEWGVFKRFKIPKRNQERNPENPLRLRRILQAEQLGLIYFNVLSKTNGHRFRLHIELQRVEPAVIAKGASDTYGLSSTTRMVPLPLLP